MGGDLKQNGLMKKTQVDEHARYWASCRFTGEMATLLWSRLLHGFIKHVFLMFSSLLWQCWWVTGRAFVVPKGFLGMWPNLD